MECSHDCQPHQQAPHPSTLQHTTHTHSISLAFCTSEFVQSHEQQKIFIVNEEQIVSASAICLSRPMRLKCDVFLRNVLFGVDVALYFSGVNVFQFSCKCSQFLSLDSAEGLLEMGTS